MVQTQGVPANDAGGQNLSGCRHNRRLSGENAVGEADVKTL